LVSALATITTAITGITIAVGNVIIIATGNRSQRLSENPGAFAAGVFLCRGFAHSPMALIIGTFLNRKSVFAEASAKSPTGSHPAVFTMFADVYNKNLIVAVIRI